MTTIVQGCIEADQEQRRRESAEGLSLADVAAPERLRRFTGPIRLQLNQIFGWWWTQSDETGLRGANSLETGKEQGISSENAREVKIAGDFPLLNQ